MKDKHLRDTTAEMLRIIRKNCHCNVTRTTYEYPYSLDGFNFVHCNVAYKHELTRELLESLFKGCPADSYLVIEEKDDWDGYPDGYSVGVYHQPKQTDRMYFEYVKKSFDELDYDPWTNTSALKLKVKALELGVNLNDYQAKELVKYNKEIKESKEVLLPNDMEIKGGL